MNIRSHKQGPELIVYDADRIHDPDVRLFDVDFWRQQDALAGEAIGRGSARFVDAPFGRAVLREYLRGGLPGRFIRARYLFTGWTRARPVAEFHVLEKLFEAGLPVPAPLAALVRRHGLSYSGSLLTLQIENTVTLADRLAVECLDDSTWRQVGVCIRRFHGHGLVHADLNARNILIDGEGTVYLIDFDRARFAPGNRPAFARNIGRLNRSLKKIQSAAAREFPDDGWDELLEGYQGGGKGHADS